ncbi:MAG: agmatine deiminase family protein [Breznakibacter sp.]|nr:agmatine deiminase family protein [Breznakibacter sp.]
MKKRVLPPEWAEQEYVQLTWPHAASDWAPYLNEAIACFKEIAKAVIKHQKLIIVCVSIKEVKEALQDVDLSKISFIETNTNDTWARDHGGITVIEEDKGVIHDFMFNGWGLKFASNYDNLITKELYTKLLSSKYQYRNQLNFILEGGGIESDGEGTLLTTAECLLSPNRNGGSSKEEIELFLKKEFGLDRILWLNHGYLAGDDTDSHVDTLARLCSVDTIAYVQCKDKADEHYEALKLMEDELKSFKTAQGEPYRLIALPMAEPVEFEGERLPATYANFLIMNGAVLVPTYNSTLDKVALDALKQVFTDREIVGIDCSVLIKQHGSLHCVTMQYPKI